jgi:hypothetical protein
MLSQRYDNREFCIFGKQWPILFYRLPIGEPVDFCCQKPFRRLVADYIFMTVTPNLTVTDVEDRFSGNVECSGTSETPRKDCERDGKFVNSLQR